jgi:hypothetical protein
VAVVAVSEQPQVFQSRLAQILLSQLALAAMALRQHLSPDQAVVTLYFTPSHLRAVAVAARLSAL